MSFLEKAIAFFSPEHAYVRQCWRQELKRSNYDAAEPGRGMWRVDNTNAEWSLSFDRDTVRARARDLERNTDLLNGILSAFSRNVIGGAGFQLQAKNDDVSVNTQIETAWNEWCKPENCDITGTQNFTEICRTALRRKKVDGGVLILLRYTAGPGVPLKLQLLEVDALDASRVEPHAAGNRVVSGVEVNAFGRAAGYWIQDTDIYGNVTGSHFEDAASVIFYHTKQRPTQIREISDFAPVLARIRDIHEFMDAVSVKERVGACFSVFIRRQAPVGGFGRASIVQPRDDYTHKRLSPGMIAELEPGEDISVAAPPGQGTAAADYIALQMHLIASGIGLSYETISRDMSRVNYSSARQGQIEDSLTFAQERETLAVQVLDAIFAAFLHAAFTSGVLKLPGYWANPEQYAHHVWALSAKPWIDPLKEAKARAAALKAGVMTFAQVSAESGHDWRDQIDEIAEIAAYAEERGVDLATMWDIDAGKTAKPTKEGSATNGAQNNA